MKEADMGNAAKILLRLRAALYAAAVLIVLLSCASGSGGGSWNAYPEAPAYWDYRTGAIVVTVDHAPEEGIASQIGVMAETLLAGGAEDGINAGALLLIDIRVEQRSFLQGVEILNAIYVDCLIRDGEGRVFGKEYEYRVGKGSILSAREQERIFRTVLGRILTSRRNRYREIMKAQKDAASEAASGDE
jgi:hypothetical protein